MSEHSKENKPKTKTSERLRVTHFPGSQSQIQYVLEVIAFGVRLAIIAAQQVIKGNDFWKSVK